MKMNMLKVVLTRPARCAGNFCDRLAYITPPEIPKIA